MSEYPTRRRDLVGVGVTAVVWAITTLLVVPALRTPPHVERVVIDNPHPWHVHVDVAGPDRADWAGLGLVERDGDHAFGDVLDQGGTWIFRFTYAGVTAETLLSRSELEADDWRVTVPDRIASELRRAGVPPTPL